MEITFRLAEIEDAEVLAHIYNEAFYSDYVKYGECPGYGKTKEMMEKSIVKASKFLIACDGRPVGVISCKKIEENVKFYTEKCHFDIEGIEMDGNVKVYRFVRDRSRENNA